MTDNMNIIQIPPFSPKDFPSQELYERAVRTSEALRDRTKANVGTDELFITDELLPVFICGLVNAAHAVGFGVLHDADTTVEEVSQFLAEQFSHSPNSFFIDYYNGRPIKLKQNKRTEGGWLIDTWLYNRDQGDGKAEKVYDHIMRLIFGGNND